MTSSFSVLDFLRTNGLARPSRVAILAIVLGGGAALTVWTHGAMHRDALRTARAEAHQHMQERLELLRMQVLRSTEVLHSIAAFFEASQEVTRTEFRRFVRPALTRQPELQALEWIPRVTAQQRPHVERMAEADGFEGFRFVELDAAGVMVPASVRPEHFPVYFVEPVRGNAPALGLDLGADARRREALDRAVSTGEPSATGPIRLAQGAPEMPGFLLFQAVRDRDGGLLGFGLAVFHAHKLVEPALAPLARRALRVEVSDAAEPGRILYADGPDAGDPAWTNEVSLPIAGRTWRVRVQPSPGFVVPGPGWAGWALPAGIATTALLLAAYLVSWMRRTADIESKVAEKTVELSREIVVRQEAEAAMRVAEAKYRGIFQNAINGIFQTTPDGRYLSANPALSQIYGYESPEALLAECDNIGRQLYVDPGRREEFVRQVTAHGVVEDFVSQVRRRDGAVIWVSEKAFAVRDAAGAVQYFEGLVEDVTARVQAAEAQRRAQEFLEERVAVRTAQLAQEVEVRKRAEAAAEAANRAKSLFLADMSHEIRTPLNAILGYTQLLQREQELMAAHGEAMRAIIEGGNHLMCLVDGVLDLTKIEVGRMELAPVDFNLTLLIRGMAAMFAPRCQQKGLRLQVESLGEAPVWLHGDERKLRQVLVNLLGNAVKFTTAGEVRLRVVPVGAAGTYRFEVIDTGPGVPLDAQTTIFEPFRQASIGRASGGTGLGLSIARRLIELMGGSLAVNSRPGWGSNFFFALAFEPACTVVPIDGGEPPLALRLAPGERVRALVVDDVPVNCQVLARLLRALGCDVAMADGGLAAIEHCGEQMPDIVFLDLRMPDLDGLAVAHLLRTREGRPADKPKLVCYSAAAFEHEREAIDAAGFDAVLSKPFRFELIAQCLARVLGVTFCGGGEPALAEEGGELADLPPDCVARWRAAAEIGDFAALRRGSSELEVRGGRAAEYARRVRLAAERFDTDHVLTLLGQGTELVVRA